MTFVERVGHEIRLGLWIAALFVVLLALLVPRTGAISPLVTAAASTLVLVVVAAWKWRSLGGSDLGPGDAAGRTL